MIAHVQTVDRIALGSEEYLPKTEASFFSRAKEGSSLRYFVSGPVSEKYANKQAYFFSESTAGWIGSKPLRWQTSLNYLNSLVNAEEGKPVLIIEDDVSFTTRFEDKLQTLAEIIPVDDYILSLYTPLTVRERPIAQISPETFWGNQALYISAGVVERLARFMGDALNRWTPDEPENDVACDILVRKFAIEHGVPIYVANPSLVQHIGAKSTGLNPFTKQHYAARFYQGPPRVYTYKPPNSFCTFATEGLEKEVCLLLASISLYHPNTPVYVISDAASVGTIMGQFKNAIVKVGVNPTDVARRRDEWLRHNDPKTDPFIGMMSFKMDAVDLALKSSLDTVYLDADVVLLDEFERLPNCEFAAAKHHHDPKSPERDPMYGTYNAGIVYVGSQYFSRYWREAYMQGRSIYCDQSCLDDATDRFDFHMLGFTSNYGHWRLWNNTVGNTCGFQNATPRQICEFAGITCHDGIRLHGKPLLSVHVHNFSDISELHPANGALKRMFRHVLSQSRIPSHQELYSYYQHLECRT